MALPVRKGKITLGVYLFIMYVIETPLAINLVFKEVLF
jgi:hypothetical protein